VRFNDLGGLVRELKSKVDLVAFISRDFPLVQRGSRWVGPCPFHADKAPSFAVLPPKDGTVSKWGCHPCNLKGDLFDYVQTRQQCTLVEAAEFIIDAIGFDATPYMREATESEALLEAQYRYVTGMARFFHECLIATPEMMFWLTEERGLDPETLARFQIGFCPSIEFAQQHFPAEALLFVEPNDKAWGNIFGGHIIIPQFTVTGQVWGWYSRRQDGKPKYVSTSSKSPLYDPSARMYGLSQAKRIPDRDKSKIVIVEGFFDVMMAQQNGFAAVATCGTALTDNHIQTLHEHSIREAVVVYDGDTAGRTAMEQLALRAHNIDTLNLKFSVIPGDPDEFLDQHGAEAFNIALDKAVCAVEFVIAHYGRADLTSPTARTDLYQQCISYLASIPRSAFTRQIGVDALARVLTVDTDMILADLDRRSEPPLCSEIAEQTALAEFLADTTAFSRFPQLKANHFGFHIHQTLYGVMADLYASGASVGRDIMLHEISARRLGPVYVKLLDALVDKDRMNAERFIAEIIDKATRRSMTTLLDRTKADLCDLKTNLSGAVSTAIEQATKMLVGDATRQTVFTNAEATNKALSIFEARQQGNDETIGLNAGPHWSRLMGWTGGFRPGRLHVVAALSGVGKSIVLLNWVHGLSMHPRGSRAHGLVVSMEMSEQENIVRLLAMDAGVPYDHINRGRTNDFDSLLKVREAFLHLQQASLTWMIGQQSVAQIAVQARMLKAKGMLDYIALDYIQLLSIMGYPNGMSTHEKYALASQELKDLADTLEVPILMAAQLNRGAYTSAEPSGEHMGSCLKIYQDAHVVYILADRQDGMIGILDKNRDGAGKQLTYLQRSYEPGLACLRVWETAE
jgi:DNA primase catalytic core